MSRVLLLNFCQINSNLCPRNFFSNQCHCIFCCSKQPLSDQSSVFSFTLLLKVDPNVGVVQQIRTLIISQRLCGSTNIYSSLAKNRGSRYIYIHNPMRLLVIRASLLQPISQSVHLSAYLFVYLLTINTPMQPAGWLVIIVVALASAVVFAKITSVD